MENLNHTLFLWMNAQENPNTLLLGIATFFAEYAIGVVPVLIAIGWLRGSEHSSPRVAGITLALLGLPMAWARIYLGVHFPLDMVGAALVAALSAWLALREVRWYLPPVYKLASSLHGTLFNQFIARGWVRK